MRRRDATSRDRELEAGSLAHYEDPAYYAATYARRIEDVAYYVSLAARARGPVLEYGVGNGRIAIPMARHGIEVVGVDHSAAMLRGSCARGSATKRPRFEDASAPSAATCAARASGGGSPWCWPRSTRRFTSTRAPTSSASLRACGTTSRRGADSSLDLSMPAPEDLARRPERAYHAPRFRHPTTRAVVKNREYFDYDPVRQVLFVSMEFEPVGDPSGAWMTPLAHRQFFPQEWAMLLHYNGFDVERVEGDFCGGPLTKDSEVMVWHARRRRKAPRTDR